MNVLRISHLQSQSMMFICLIENDVMIVDQTYFTHNFKAQTIQRQNMIDATVTKFRLNLEQERAFRIVANHSSSSASEQLKMYLGGMAGTGKSQVI